MEASFRQNYGTTNQSDSPMTKVDRSTYSAFSNKLSKGTPSQYWVQRFINRTTVTFILHQMHQQLETTCI